MDRKTRKIVFVIRYFHPFIGGLEKKVLNLASVLNQRGVNVEILTSRFYKEWPKSEKIRGVAVCRIASPRIKIAGALVFLAGLCKYLFQNRSCIEAIHAFQVGYSSAAAVCMGKLLSKPTLLSLSSSGKGGDIIRHRKSPWGRAFLFLCRLASRILVLNADMRRELQMISYHEHAILSVTNGVDPGVFQRAENRKELRQKMGIDKEKIILYTGRLSSEKGLAFLIRAYAKLGLAMPTKLYVLGDGPELPRLRKLIRQYHLENRVILLPAKEDVASHLQTADIFVMPSEFEGLSNSVLEAMACALPVIATRVEGNAELIEDRVTGLLVAYGDEEQMKKALTFLLTNPEEARDIGFRAQKKVQKNHDLDKVAEEYIRLYKNLVQTT